MKPKIVYHAKWKLENYIPSKDVKPFPKEGEWMLKLLGWDKE